LLARHSPASQLTRSSALGDQPSRHWAWFALSLALGVGTIWLIPFEGHDGVIIGQASESGDWRGVRLAWLGTNWYLLYPLFRLNDWLAAHTGVPYWVWGKLVLTASVAGLAYEARHWSREVLGLGARNAGWVALLVLVFPGWCVLYGTGWMNIVFMWVAFSGHRLACGSGIASRVIGCVLMLVSLQVNSNLVVLPALEAVRWITHRTRAKRWQWTRSLIIGVMVIGVYAALKWMTPPQGLYAGYNELLWPTSLQNLIQIAKACVMFATWGLLWLVPVLLAFAWSVVSRRAPALHQTHAESRVLSSVPDSGSRPLKWFGVLLLLTATIFPYVMVGKGAPLFVIPSMPVSGSAQSAALAQASSAWVTHLFDGWNARHTWLMAVPLSALTVLTLVRIVPTPKGQRVALLAAWICSLGWLGVGHHAKLARYADEQAIVNALRLAGAPAAGEVDLVVSPTRLWLATGDSSNYLMWRAFGRTDWATEMYYADEPTWRDRRLASRAEYGRGVFSPQKQTLVNLTNLMQDYRFTSCRTIYSVQLFAPSVTTLLTSGVNPSRVPPADLHVAAANCPSTPK
jgi:hypothetical protein